MSWDIYENYRPELQGYEIFILKKEHYSEIALVEPLNFTTKPTTKPGEPTLFLYKEDAKEFFQAMMDTAHRLGLKPTGIENYNNELTAVKKHKDDLKEIVYHTLGIQK